MDIGYIEVNIQCWGDQGQSVINTISFNEEEEVVRLCKTTTTTTTVAVSGWTTNSHKFEWTK